MAGKLQPDSLAFADAAKLLTAAGGKTVTPKMIQGDLEAGAPKNADGTVNLVHYAAWLVGKMRRT
jgi:hypothetical protein